jgi:hypothetical protein
LCGQIDRVSANIGSIAANYFQIYPFSERESAMLELFIHNPWLIIVCLALLIPICGIVFGTVTNHRLQMRKAELHAGLVQEMLQRGMSAEDIRMVLEASPKNAAKRCHTQSAYGKESPAQF